VKLSPVAPRLVLDTNVWLDWLVFDDPGVRSLRAAAYAGTATVFMTAACADELARVLASPLRKATLDWALQAEYLQNCRRLVHWVDDESLTLVTCLARCADPDDQKFIQLATACSADYLVTRDRALLKVGSRRTVPLPFRIVCPTDLTEAFTSPRPT